MRIPLLIGAALVLGLDTCPLSAQPIRFRTQSIDEPLTVGYGVRIVDINRDGRPDILVADSRRILWLENPDWKPHVILNGQTPPDNVCIAPCDIDGDSKIDVAIGAAWRPFQTNVGTIHWLRQGENPKEAWELLPIAEEPTVHRMQWFDCDGDGAEELLVLPLLGRDTKPPEFQEAPVRLLSFRIPQNPRKDRWVPEVLNQELHVSHNFWPCTLFNSVSPTILVASFEGVSILERQNMKWERRLLGEGNQTTRPNRGASEVKLGSLGRNRPIVATIEPWHGFQVVVYTTRTPYQVPWQRTILDERLKWGHAVWCADLDRDGRDEVIIGVRDNASAEERCGVRIYRSGDTEQSAWQRQLVDPGGVAVEDLAVADLNDDGRQDIVAVGRQTRNIRIYWNESERPPVP